MWPQSTGTTGKKSKTKGHYILELLFHLGNKEQYFFTSKLEEKAAFLAISQYEEAVNGTPTQ